MNYALTLFLNGQTLNEVIALTHKQITSESIANYTFKQKSMDGATITQLYANSIIPKKIEL